MTYSLQERLSIAEEQFLQAMSEGLPALQVFQDAWHYLHQDLQCAVEDQTLKQETALLWDAVASRVETLSNQLFELHSDALAMTATFESELDRIFERVDVPDISSDESGQSDDERQRKKPPAGSIKIEESISPSYLRQALEWLRANLHNPYPSRETREHICRQTRSDQKDVDAWFIEMRRRIGWNKLRKNYFGNRRVDILDAAAEHFQRRGEGTLKQTVRQAFVRMQLLVDDMCNEHYSQSKLADKFDDAVKNMTPELRAEAERERRQRPIASSSRKRRLSFSDSDFPLPKRPRGQSNASRPYAVSDPLPIPQSAAFDIPPLVSTDDFDSTLMLDVQLGDFAQFDLPSSPFAQSVHPTPPVQLSSPNPESPSSLSDSNLNFDFDHLNNWIWNAPFQTPPEPFPYDFLEPPFDASRNLPQALDIAMINDNSQFVAHHSASRPDWTSQAYTFSSNETGLLDELQGIGFPAFPPNIFDSLSAERTLFDEFSRILTQTSKAEKQRTLIEAKELTRRLEAAIAAS